MTLPDQPHDAPPAQAPRPAALIDRGLRARVIEANRREPMLEPFGAVGIGHDWWVDPQPPAPASPRSSATPAQDPRRN